MHLVERMIPTCHLHPYFFTRDPWILQIIHHWWLLTRLSHCTTFTVHDQVKAIITYYGYYKALSRFNKIQTAFMFLSCWDHLQNCLYDLRRHFEICGAEEPLHPQQPTETSRAPSVGPTSPGWCLWFQHPIPALLPFTLKMIPVLTINCLLYAHHENGRLPTHSDTLM